MGITETRPYPAWWRERAAMRRCELDRAVEHLRAAVAMSDDLVGVLVFGSYAAGTVGPSSDLDLIVITREAAHGDRGGRYARLHRRLIADVTCDLLVYEAADFELLRTTQPFVIDAFRHGIWIDGAVAP